MVGGPATPGIHSATAGPAAAACRQASCRPARFMHSLNTSLKKMSCLATVSLLTCQPILASLPTQPTVAAGTHCRQPSSHSRSSGAGGGGAFPTFQVAASTDSWGGGSCEGWRSIPAARVCHIHVDTERRSKPFRGCLATSLPPACASLAVLAMLQNAA